MDIKEAIADCLEKYGSDAEGFIAGLEAKGLKVVSVSDKSSQPAPDKDKEEGPLSFVSLREKGARKAMEQIK